MADLDTSNAASPDQPWGAVSRIPSDSSCSKDVQRGLGSCRTTLDSLPITTLDELPSLDDDAGQMQVIEQLEAIARRESGELGPVDDQVGEENSGYQEEHQFWGIHGMYELGYDLRDHLDGGSLRGTGEPFTPQGTFVFMRRAVRLHDTREVLVKCVSSNQQPDRLKRQELLDEYLLLRSLRHEAIISAEALIETRFDSWLVMETCTCSLQACVERVGAFSEERARDLFLQLLRGMQHMHRRRVVHRGLQPANLLLEGRPFSLKIANFGHAKQLQATITDDDTSLQMDGQARQYLAPELLLRRLWDERVDVWTAGLSFHFKMRSQLPFDVESMRVLSELSAGLLPREAQWHGLSDHAQELISRCLTVDPCSRPSVDELLQHQMEKN